MIVQAALADAQLPGSLLIRKVTRQPSWRKWKCSVYTCLVQTRDDYGLRLTSYLFVFGAFPAKLAALVIWR